MIIVHWSIVLLSYLLCIQNTVLSNSSLTINKARELAQKSHRAIFVKYEADWCLPCQILNENISKDNRIKTLLAEGYINITANIDHIDDTEWFDKYNITALPTIVILSENGNILLRSTGSFSADGLFHVLDQHSTKENEANRIDYRDLKSTAIMNKIETTDHLPIEVTTENQIFTVTIGAFAFKQNAINYQKEIENRFAEKTYITSDPSNSLYRLNIGKYQFKQEGYALTKKLKEEMVDCYIRKIL